MNWTSTKPQTFLSPVSKIREKHELHEKTLFFYGGNLGRSNDMNNLMKLAKNLRNYVDAHFLIIGQGDEYELDPREPMFFKMSNFLHLHNKYQRIEQQQRIWLLSMVFDHSRIV